MRVGIDVGGTHTDAVVMRGKEIVASHKALTTEDIMTGINDALNEVMGQAACGGDAIRTVMIGTTQLTNAVIARKGLQRVYSIRATLPGGAAVPPRAGWPKDLAAAVDGGSRMIHGGIEYNGRDFATLIDQEIEDTIAELSDAAVDSQTAGADPLFYFTT